MANPLESAARPQYTLPEWARLRPYLLAGPNNPALSGAQIGNTSVSGGGMGLLDYEGFYNAGLGGFSGGMTGNGDSQSWSPGKYDEFNDWLRSTGQTLYESNNAGQNVRWLQDAQGNITAEPQLQSLDDDNFGIAALLAGGVVGGAAAGLYGGAAAGTGAASGAGAAAGMTAEQVAMLAANGLTDAQIAAMATAAGDTAMASSLTGAGLGAAAGAGSGALAQAGSAASTAAGGAGGAGGASSLIGDAAKAVGGAMDWSDWAKIGVTLIGSGIQSNAASNAVDAQAKSTEAAIAEQRRQFDLQRSDGAAYRDAGVNALSQFQTLANTPTTAADVMQDPGYQFGLDQGQQAIDRKVAAMGGRVSGAAIKAAGRFGTNYATTGYTAADQRRNDRLNRLASLAGIGQSATNASASAGTAMANNIGGLVTGQGNAAGGGMLAQGNIWGNAANQLAALYGRSTQSNQAPASSGWAGDGWGSGNGWGNQDMGLEYGP